MRWPAREPDWFRFPPCSARDRSGRSRPGRPKVGLKQPLETLRRQRRKVGRKQHGETRTAARRALEAQHAGLIERRIFIVHDGRAAGPRGVGDARIGRHDDDPSDPIGALQHIESAARQKIGEIFARPAQSRGQALLGSREPLHRNHRPDCARHRWRPALRGAVVGDPAALLAHGSDVTRHTAS